MAVEFSSLETVIQREFQKFSKLFCDHVKQISDLEMMVKTIKSENEILKSEVEKIYKNLEPLVNECEQLLGSVNSCADTLLRLKDLKPPQQ